MEALTAAAVAALTVYDMAKAIDKEMVIADVTPGREDEGSRMRAAVLTVSDGVVAGTREDKSGDMLAELLAGDGYEVERRVVPDEAGEIAAAIAELAESAAVVLTTGGTGVAPRDVTPEATRTVIDREAPGSRRRSARTRSRRRRTHCSRAGSRASTARTLVVNLPGSPGGCRDGYAVLQPALGHALGLLAEAETAHRQT